MKKICSLFIFLLSVMQLNAQQKNVPEFRQPKLIIGIVIDQMRADYIYKYWDKLSDNGFKKFIADGFECRNTQYNYVPTYTAPGHTSIFTGTTPEIHGIIGNNWYQRSTDAVIYCAADAKVHAVGGNERAGQMSPEKMLTTTFGDELRLFSNFRSKVIGVSLKDRAAVFPAGHSGKAYWFDNTTNDFISSTYYVKDTLPSWLRDFNSRNLPEKYLSGQWKPLLDINDYSESTSDNNIYEGTVDTSATALPVFNYDLKKLQLLDPDLLRKTPFGNTVTKEIAIAAIEGEQLGDDQFCDMLTVSFSSTDYVGHLFGTNAIETEDTYLRLDKDLAELINYAERKLGRENILIFLTADHAALPNPVFLKDNHLPGGYLYEQTVTSRIKSFLQSAFKDSGLFKYYINDQIYLNDSLIAAGKYNRNIIEDRLAEELLRLDFIADVIPSHLIAENDYIYGMKRMVSRGYNRKRSGDAAVLYQPGFIESYGGRRPESGTTHGSPYKYDTMVPLYFYGWNIKKGSTDREIYITDIAATISSLLNICQPSGCTGKPISEITGH
jgi:predicted AlkP superfamily pyrophosphatase or phosphodiesterase